MARAFSTVGRSIAGATVTLTTSAHIGVARSVGVAARTVCLTCVDAWASISTKDVHPMAYYFEVIGIRARSIATEMINFAPVRDLALKMFVGEPVCVSRPTGNVQCSVAGAHLRTSPQPAARLSNRQFGSEAC